MAGRSLPDIALTSRVISRRDLLQLSHELERIRDYLISKRVKQEKIDLPHFSERVKAFLDANKVKKLDEASLEQLIKDINYSVDRVPMVRFTFAGEPDGALIKRLIEWLRSEIDPMALMIYTVQPQIAGGFVLTTDRKRYDLSWRAELNRQPLKLGEVLRNAK